MAPAKRTLGLAGAAFMMVLALFAMSAGRLFVAGVLFLAASLTLYAAETRY